MEDSRNTRPVLTALILGALLWWIAAALSGRREAWDGAAYWALAYPLSIAACAWLGYRYPQRPWRWALLLFEGQFLAMCVRNGELGNLWPMGMLLFAIVGLPGVLAARLAARRSAAEAPLRDE
jgi:hypothetical protein